MLKKLYLITAAVALTSSSSFANDMNISGFFNGVIAEENGEYNIREQSKLGIQIEGKLTENLSGTMQVVNRASPISEKKRETTFEYAFLSYKITPDTTLKAGRLRLPLFMLSEYVEVGAIVPWIESPSSVYQQMPANRYDGIDMSYDFNTNEAGVTIQAYIGNSEADVSLSGLETVVDLERVMGTNISINYEDWSFRVGYAKSDVAILLGNNSKKELEFNLSLLNAGIDDSLNAAEYYANTDPSQSLLYQRTAQGLETQAGQINTLLTFLPDREKMAILSLGFSGQISERFSVMGEYVEINSNHKIENDDKGYYLAATYDFGIVNTTLTWSQRESLNEFNTKKTNSDQYIATVSYETDANWYIKAEINRTISEINNVNEKADTKYMVSMNYVF
jgi:hypothetical protein